MTDLRVYLMMLEGDENMAYRPENGNGDQDDLDSYWRRKQSVKANRVTGEAREAGPDRDAERAASNWKGESGKLDRGQSLWDDEAWKDKDQHGR